MVGDRGGPGARPGAATGVPAAGPGLATSPARYQVTGAATRAARRLASSRDASPASSFSGRVHEPKVTIVQKRTRYASMKADPADVRSEATSKVASVGRIVARSVVLS